LEEVHEEALESGWNLRRGRRAGARGCGLRILVVREERPINRVGALDARSLDDGEFGDFHFEHDLLGASLHRNPRGRRCRGGSAVVEKTARRGEKRISLGRRSRATRGSGGLSLLFFIAFCIKVYLDGNWNVPIATWTLDYVVGSMVLILEWVLIIFGIPAAIGIIWWIRHEAKKGTSVATS